MTEISAFAALLSRDHGLCVLSTLRGDGGIQSSVVNAGVMTPDHEKSSKPVTLTSSGTRKPARWSSVKARSACRSETAAMAVKPRAA